MADDGAVFLGLILGSGERADGFGKQLEVVDMKRDFPGLGAEHHSFSLDEIADVEHLVEEVQAFLAHFVHAEE